MSQNHRLIIAMLLSIIIMIFWQEYYVIPHMPKTQFKAQEDPLVPAAIIETAKIRELLLQEQQDDRMPFINSAVRGSIHLRGAKIDDLLLKDYKEDIQTNSPQVALLHPAATSTPYYISIGWVSADKGIILPDSTTLWQTNVESLTPKSPATLTWLSPQNLLFSIKISLDEDYIFNIEQSVENNSVLDVTLKPYTTISRTLIKDKTENMIAHRGPIGVVDGKLKEIAFDDLIKEARIDFKSGIDWFGFSDKYWLTTFINHNPKAEVRFSSHPNSDMPKLQADLLYPTNTIGAGQTLTETTKAFVGAKELNILKRYQSSLNIPMFDHAVDFGKLYFITKPIFMVLNKFHAYLGNFGLAILLLTVSIKLILFPIAYKGYVGMNRLRDLQPKMKELKEQYADDTQGFQKALVELYKKEKVNPAAGCIPMILQMPVFFALYKVLYVTIEMRHAPFYGWIHDLSAPDPTSIFNLFGLIPWGPPSFMMIGVYPILMSLTMFLQQRMGPEPTDPTQAQVMKLLPLILLFTFSSFPSGMVIYWAWSNILSIIQQLLIKRLTAR
jgi:YidC/Oxa1 family membrane protein insertase